MRPRCCRPGRWPATSWMLYTTSCNTQSSAPEDGQNNCPKHVELIGIINKPLLFHLVGCLYYLYQWCTVKQISDNEIYLLIKYIKSLLWRVAKRLSYKEGAWCLKVKRIAPGIFGGLAAYYWIEYTTDYNLTTQMVNVHTNDNIISSPIFFLHHIYEFRMTLTIIRNYFLKKTLTDLYL